MAQDTFPRLRATLQEVLHATQMHAREIEDRLGIGHGMLKRLLDGSVELRLHHLFGFARVLEIDPRELLALDAQNWTVRHQLIDWMSPRRRKEVAAAQQPALSDELSAAVREIVREELARHGLAEEPAPSRPKKP
jgi:transcriptional regulator with XRE-family HTH domain